MDNKIYPELECKTIAETLRWIRDSVKCDEYTYNQFDLILDKLEKSYTKSYVIFSQSESDIQEEYMYWSNTLGWTTYEFADKFTEQDKQYKSLPDTGRWEETNE